MNAESEEMAAKSAADAADIDKVETGNITAGAPETKLEAGRDDANEAAEAEAANEDVPPLDKNESSTSPKKLSPAEEKEVHDSGDPIEQSVSKLAVSEDKDVAITAEAVGASTGGEETKAEENATSVENTKSPLEEKQSGTEAFIGDVLLGKKADSGEDKSSPGRALDNNTQASKEAPTGKVEGDEWVVIDDENDTERADGGKQGILAAIDSVTRFAMKIVARMCCLKSARNTNPA